MVFFQRKKTSSYGLSRVLTIKAHIFPWCPFSITDMNVFKMPVKHSTLETPMLFLPTETPADDRRENKSSKFSFKMVRKKKLGEKWASIGPYKKRINKKVHKDIMQENHPVKGPSITIHFNERWREEAGGTNKMSKHQTELPESAPGQGKEL